MILVDNQQRKREETGNPIRVGVIGVGEMGRGIVNQVTRYSPGITISAIYNRTLEKALEVIHVAGIKEHVVARTVKELEDAIASGITAITQDIDMLIEAKGLDILLEVTGTIEFAARAILKAFEHKKHVLSFNAEIDATLGPILKLKSKEHGVLYGVSDGDQPGVTMNLYRYVTSMGFKPLLCGNIKGLQDHYRTPATQASFAKQWGMTPEMVTSFADGTKISIEQACIANATNMKVAVRGMYGYHYQGHVDEMTGMYDINQLKELGGIVDYVVGPKPAPGVFIYATTDDPIAVKYLRYGKLGEGPLYSFYVPYHLLFFDIASSIVRMVDFNDPVISPLAGPVVEVVATAKTDLAVGDTLDTLGGFTVYGQCENSPLARKDNLLPVGLIEGLKLKRNVPKDQVLTLDDVDVPLDSLVFNLFNQQLKVYNQLE